MVSPRWIAKLSAACLCQHDAATSSKKPPIEDCFAFHTFFPASPLCASHPIKATNTGWLMLVLPQASLALKVSWIQLKSSLFWGWRESLTWSLGFRNQRSPSPLLISCILSLVIVSRSESLQRQQTSTIRARQPSPLQRMGESSFTVAASQPSISKWCVSASSSTPPPPPPPRRDRGSPGCAGSQTGSS